MTGKMVAINQDGEDRRGTRFGGQVWESWFGYAKLDIQVGMLRWQLGESEIPGEGSARDKRLGAISYRY